MLQKDYIKCTDYKKFQRFIEILYFVVVHVFILLYIFVSLYTDVQTRSLPHCCIVLYSFPIQDLPCSLVMATCVQPTHAAAVTCVTDGVYRLQYFTYKYCHSSQRSLAVKLYRVPTT
jgi:hypothetical protein